MHKLITLGSWDFGIEPISLVKMSRRGLLDNDRGVLVKRAGSEFADKVRNVKLAAGEIPVHLIAMGATEMYGPNRNGDGFGDEALAKYAHTFETSARWYRNHQNKNPDKSYGVVKLAWYNRPMRRVELLVALNGNEKVAKANGGLVADDEMRILDSGGDLPVSMACFKEDAVVRMWRGDAKSISDICIGDEVLTHHGNRGVVTATSKRPYQGDFVRLFVTGLPDPVESTDQHRIWARPTIKGKTPRCPVCSKQFKSLQAHLWQHKDPQHKAAAEDFGRYSEGWFEANELTPGDFVRIPIDQTVTERGDPAYAELLGYYLAEGSTWQNDRFAGRPIDTYRGVDFSFHIDEADLADRVVSLLHRLGYTRTRVYLRKNNVRLVRVSAAELADRLERDGGKGAYGKRIAADIMRWSPETQLLTLQAWLEGDGTFSKTHQCLVGVSVSQELCRQMALIAWRNGIVARLNRCRASKSYDTCTIVREDVPKLQVSKVPKDFQTASPCAAPCGQLKHQPAGATTKPHLRSRPHNFIEGGFLYCRLRKVERIYDECLVYNMTVESDNSYTVGAIGVSNCKIAFDACSACGHKAASRKEYCQSKDEGGSCSRFGCRTGLMKVADDGFIQYVDNPDPHFFDISKVYRNADRIAFGSKADELLKAASADHVIGGAELAEAAGLLSPISLLLSPTASDYENNVVKLAYRLADIEDQIESTQPGDRRMAGLALAFAREAQPKMDLSPMGQPGSVKFATGLAALAGQRISLPVREFLRLVVDERSEKYAALVEEVPGLLPGVYNRLIAEGELSSRVRSNPFRPSQDLAPASQRQWAAKNAETHSLDPSLVQLRSSLMAIRHTASPTVMSRHDTVKMASASSESHELARRYAVYKLAFLAAQESDAPLTCETAVRQNYVC